MKILLVVALVCMVSCKSKKRYFFVTYSTNEKNGNHNIEGDTWFSSDGYFDKNRFDSGVYNSLDKKRECYQDVVIRNIIEFKNEEDYNSFGKHPESSRAKKKDCECDSIPIVLFGYGTNDMSRHLGIDTLNRKNNGH